MTLLAEMDRILAIDAYTAQLEANLASRREKRPAHREAGLKGAATKRRAQA